MSPDPTTFCRPAGRRAFRPGCRCSTSSSGRPSSGSARSSCARLAKARSRSPRAKALAATRGRSRSGSTGAVGISVNAAKPRGRLVAVEIDARSIGGGPGYIDQERAAAIRDLIAENLFAPEGRDGEAYRLRLSVAERKLVLEITDVDHVPVISHILSLTPLRRVVRDYFILCESFYAAVPMATPAQIEAIDMGRRGLHDEGAEILRERLKGKVAIDLPTARRLFTLVS